MSDQQDGWSRETANAISLDDDQIEARPRSASRLGRRSFLLGAVGGTTAVAGCMTTGITDADVGRYADPVGDGRGGHGRTGITDADMGRGADPVGGGRGARRRSCTDADLGFFSDPVGRGRRC